MQESIVSWARPVGILTDRDLIVRVLTRTDRIPATTTLAEVMQHDVITARRARIEQIVARLRDQIQAVTKLFEGQGGSALLHI